MAKTRYPRVSTFKSADALRDHLEGLGVGLELDDEILSGEASPLSRSLDVGDGLVAGNRFAIQPMEGWDGTTDGMPTETVRRRWTNFGLSGAKLIWGGEAFAVRPEGRANPNQLMCRPRTCGGVAELYDLLVTTHAERFGTTEDLVVGLQLTHSGRFCRPFRKDRMEPAIAYRHPILDAKFGIAPEDDVVLSDEDLVELIELYIQGARIARDAGYDFVDIKHCHGYLGHELLSGFTREGRFGGEPFENRTRFLCEIVEGIRAKGNDIAIGVRLSAFDFVPFRPDPEQAEGDKLGPGIPEAFADILPYTGFGCDRNDPLCIALAETHRFLDLLRELGIHLVNLSCGSPYYNPHIQRPALFPPSDGYQPPEDPLMGVARQINTVATIKSHYPDLAIVGTGYSYLQEYLPHVGQAQVRACHIDFVGLGRMALSYPQLPADVLETGTMERAKICRTFSDCTTAPRSGMISGCFPLDPFYKERPEAEQLKQFKAGTGA
ncbi:MAG: NADH:flavin oxidoreductase [Candidatus Latescibacterota bacterium]|nr:NADH:flavin oxidoreductase [Candidatus Latescibacterota bacterium]